MMEIKPEQMDANIERRAFTITELRVNPIEGDEPEIHGYAAVFNELSDDLGGFYERIEPGAFAMSLGSDDVRALWNHNSDYPLGRIKAGTLSLDEDQKGLRFVIKPPDTQWARDLLVSIQRGDVDQMSFAFMTVQDRWEHIGDQTIRTLLEVQLYDVSPVTYPAYPQTSAAVRSQLEIFKSRSLEARDADEKARSQVRNRHRKRKIEIMKKHQLFYGGKNERT